MDADADDHRERRRWFPESAVMGGFTMWTGDDAETRAANWTSPRDGTGWDIRQP